MANKQSPKVLVVDDDPDILELLKYNLKKEGYDVETAEDGMKGVSIAKRFKFTDLLIKFLFCLSKKKVSILSKDIKIFIKVKNFNLKNKSINILNFNFSKFLIKVSGSLTTIAYPIILGFKITNNSIFLSSMTMFK